jgi:LacI family transcriptional regulator
MRDEHLAHGDFTEEGGWSAARALVAQRRPRPTALFAANDAMAVGALLALREADIDVPGDISVVGFDDIPIARYVAPPLTTVRVRIAELGDLALERLVQAIDKAGRDDHVIQTLRTELVVRSSCARHPASLTALSPSGKRPP